MGIRKVKQLAFIALLGSNIPGWPEARPTPADTNLTGVRFATIPQLPKATSQFICSQINISIICKSCKMEFHPLQPLPQPPSSTRSLKSTTVPEAPGVPVQAPLPCHPP